MPSETSTFKHPILFPAPMQQPSATVDLSDDHRSAMRARLYGRHQQKRAPLQSGITSEPYAGEKLDPWQSTSSSHYTAKKFTASDSNPNEAAAELKATHFKIEDPSISRKGVGASTSITKSDYVPFPEAKREGMCKAPVQPYPVIFRDETIVSAKSSIYKADFNGKAMPEYNPALTSGRANMRVAHFTLGNDNSPDRYVSVARAAEIKNLPADVFFETTNAQRRTDIKNEQMKRSNVLDTVDAEHVEWKSVSKAAFVDFTESKDYHAATKHGIKEELRQANVKLGVEHYTSNDVSTYKMDFLNRPSGYQRPAIAKPQRPGSSEGIQIKWCDHPNITQASVSSTEYVVHHGDHSSREEAKRLKEFSTKTSISIAHADAESLGDRQASISKAHYVRPKIDAKTAYTKACTAPASKLWHQEFESTYKSVSKDDYLDPNVHDPRRKEHFLENKHAVDQRTGVLRMTNFSLGSDPTKPATTYASNFVEPQSGEKHTIVKKPVDTPDHADRIIAKYADVGPRSTVYQDTFKQLSTEGSAGTVPRHRPQDAPDNIHFYNAGHTAMLKESVSRAAYCPPEMMVDRTERR